MTDVPVVFGDATSARSPAADTLAPWRSERARQQQRDAARAAQLPYAELIAAVAKGDRSVLPPERPLYFAPGAYEYK